MRLDASYLARPYDARSRKRGKAKAFESAREARRWLEDQRVAFRRGEQTASSATVTVDDIVGEWITAAHAGRVRTRGRKPFAPATVRAVEQNHRLRVSPAMGRRRVDRVTLLDLQEWVDELEAGGLNASTIETSVLPLRLAYRRAKTRGVVLVDPTDGLELPSKKRGTRVPVDIADVGRLLDALPEPDRALWTTAIQTGLRRGELLALRWEDVDLEGGVLRVERSWSPGDGYGRPKSERSRRTVPVGLHLAAVLRERRLRTGRRTGLVFGDDGQGPLSPKTIQKRADAAWKAEGVPRTTLHACRHLYVSLCAAADVQLHALSRFMGHSSIAVTVDLYGHLFRGSEAEAARRVDAFLDRIVAH